MENHHYPSHHQHPPTLTHGGPMNGVRLGRLAWSSRAQSTTTSRSGTTPVDATAP
jgi:hypothetical protein